MSASVSAAAVLYLPLDDLSCSLDSLMHALELHAEAVLLHHRLVILCLQNSQLLLDPRQILLLQILFRFWLLLLLLLFVFRLMERISNSVTQRLYDLITIN